MNITTDGIIIDGKGTTTIKGYGDGNGIFSVKAKQVTITGIKFVDTNPKNNFTYGGTVAGVAIGANGADGGKVIGCEFANFNSGIQVMGTTGFTIKDSNFTGGYTTVLKNDPSVNKEKGTKALNIYKQSQEIVVINNTFDGPMLDGVSIAQGSGSNQVINNTFIGNAYSIYFGGASTEGTVIRGNKFINCGAFKDDTFSMDYLPVISTEKSSNDISIEDNTFFAIDNNILIGAESGNEAHGDPTEISNFNITGNTVTKYSEDVNASSVLLLHILGRGDYINITEPINVSDNTIEDGMMMIAVYLGQDKFNKVLVLNTTENMVLSGIIGNVTDNSTDGNGTNPDNSTPVNPTPAPAPASTPAKADTVKLTLKKVKVKKSAKKLVLQATLKINKKAKKGAKIIFKFKGKKVGTVKTNKNGVAKLILKGKKLKNLLKKLKVGKKVTYQASYGKTVKKVTVKVKK